MAKRVTGSTKTKSSSSQPTGGMFVARVKAIILDNTTYPDKFSELGDWSSIGTIFWDTPTAPNKSQDNPTFNSIARPLFPNEKKYPLVNEIVYVMSLPNSDNESSPNTRVFYYFQPINIWTSNHHNAIPNPYENTLPPTQQQDYQSTEGGNVRRVTDGGTEIFLGQTFTEKLDIKTLLPYEGDFIYEGRWGQSLRYGSTVNDAVIPNPWSSAGENGSPITILKNGQHEDGADPWVPQVEDINQDKSSIYLTSTQKIPIETAGDNYKSYSTPPIAPNQFDGDQIILNSGRLLFNSKNDSILLNSSKTINLQSLEDINLESPKTVIESKEILLGSKFSSEPVILGNKFLNDISKLLTQIIALSTALQTPIGTPVPFVPNAAIPIPATQLQLQANQMLSSLETYKSKVTKTK
tara:strand:- start:2772 stop:3998 length:1227 start_codon:yes stop_codon:yes gene_type:complete